MRILCVASECYPLIKTGGLADVVGALPLALQEEGVGIKVFLPGFPDVLAGLSGLKEIAEIGKRAGKKARLVSGKTSTGLTIVALDAPHLFGFKGNPYVGPDGKDRPNALDCYSTFSKAAADYASGKFTDWRADILHAHDWQAGLAVAYIAEQAATKGEYSPKTVFTIHNLAFQGLFPAAEWKTTGLPKSYFTRDGLEYWDQISLMKAGLVYSDKITTVSPTYALEIQTDRDGMGLGGLLKSRAADLQGIVNGIDTDVWNPKTDPELPQGYEIGKLAGKRTCKAALQGQYGLPVKPRTPVFSVISRLTSQKGLDLLSQLVPMIVDRGGQLVLLGSGDKALEAAFTMAASEYPDHVGVQIGYNESLAHLIQAGSDITMVPSRFEPCGLTQLCGLRYGTIPLVARVGGLADTIIDSNVAALSKKVSNGVQFYPPTVEALADAVDKSFKLYADKKIWNQMVKSAMAQDVSWNGPADQYRQLYSEVIND